MRMPMLNGTRGTPECYRYFAGTSSVTDAVALATRSRNWSFYISMLDPFLVGVVKV
ncbi:hypothetical protein CGRA01v4_13489 [Colletotrichum graminicola]|nr:hypothetical protein CGRA01v4_13489 [Colletotrichum graminicola]